MKKVLSLVMVIAMVLSSMTFAFADFKDVPATNAELTDATNLLSALGIINGYEDGSFKPENSVTRAEMAKMMISALGYGKIANDTPKFTDCQKHWAKGYISLANDLGIIEGVGNNKFDPDSKVTYEQATAMLLRTLGYTNENLNGGKSTTYNSAVYKTKALSLGLFDVISNIDMKASANRGDIALMLNRNMQNQMVQTNELGRPAGLTITEGKVTSPMVLISKLANSAPLKVTVDSLSKVNSAVDLTPYLYQTVTAYTANDKVVYVDNSAAKVYEGTLTLDTKNIIITLADKTKVTVDATTDLTADEVFHNGEVATSGLNAAGIAALNYAKVVCAYNESSKKVEVQGVVYETFDKLVRVSATYRTGKDTFQTVELPKDANGKIDFSKITVTGDATSLEDIKVNDIIEVAQSEATKDKVTKIVVTRNTVEGKVTKIAGTKYYINGTAYELNKAVVGLGDNGTFFLDQNGLICDYVAGTGTQATTIYGIVQAFGTGTINDNGFAGSDATFVSYPKVKMVGMDGKVQVLDIACKADANTTTGVPTGLSASTSAGKMTITWASAPTTAKVTGTENVVVTYTLDKDGKVATITPVTLKSIAAIDAISTSSRKFLADDKTAMLDLTSNTFTPVKVSDIASDAIVCQYVGDATKGWDIVITTGKVVVVADKDYGFVTGVTKILAEDGVTQVNEVTVLMNGETKTYLTKNLSLDSKLNTAKNQLALITIEAGVLTDADTEDAGIETSAFDSINDKYAVLDGASERTYLKEGKCYIYKQNSDNTISVADIADVDFYCGEGGRTFTYTAIENAAKDKEITTIVIPNK